MNFTTVDVVEALKFTGMKGATMTAVTVPALVSPKGRTGDGCYPWGIGKTVKDAGIVKRSTVRGIVGASWARLVEDARLRTGEGLNDDGSATYTHGDAVNGTKWVVDGEGNRLAFKTNGAETALYCPIVVCESMGYDYFTISGQIIPREMVTPFLRDTSREGVRQGLSDPLVYRDYRLDHVAELKIGTSLTEGDAKRLADALANGGTHPTEGVSARDIAREFAPSIGEGVTG